MITAILPILKHIAVSILWKYVHGYLITAVKDSEKETKLTGAEKRAKALETFRVLYSEHEGKEPSADIMRKAAQEVSVVHNELEASNTL